MLSILFVVVVLFVVLVVATTTRSYASVVAPRHAAAVSMGCTHSGYQISSLGYVWFSAASHKAESFGLLFGRTWYHSTTKDIDFESMMEVDFYTGK